MTQSPIILMSGSDQTRSTVIASIQGNGHHLVEPCPTDPETLAEELDRRRYPVALVDLGPDAAAMLGRLEPLVDRFSGTRFVAVTDRPANDLMLEAMQAGVRHVIDRAELPTELRPILRRLHGAAATGGGGAGRIVTLFSASGGSGATTVAVNLGRELAAGENHSCLLLDMDLHHSTAAIYLDVEPQYRWDSVLNSPQAIDADLIATSSHDCGGGLSLLSGPSHLGGSGDVPLPLERLGEMLAACRRAAGSVVIDAPRLPAEVMQELAQASDVCLVLLQLSVKDLRATKKLLDLLEARGVPRQKLLPVANRYARRPSRVTPQEGERLLGTGSMRTLRNDYKAACRAVDFGKPLAEVAPRSAFRKDLLKLAETLSTAAVKG